MLQEVNSCIVEGGPLTTSGIESGGFSGLATTTIGGCYTEPSWRTYNTLWQSYPVYVCTDKTAKSIEILKKLQSEKVIDVKSVPRFIALVEQISAIL